MTPELWKRIEAIFLSALDLPPEKRKAFIDEASAGDATLRTAVETLLAQHEAKGSFLESPARALATTVKYAPEDSRAPGAAGSFIGVYRTVREIGRGGMGVVYLAERADSEFRKRVALKVVKRGMDTDFIVRRFRNERQILASLEHPNIARLLDGGTTEDGLPYFVMEYIEGLPVSQYCDEHKLSIPERVRLFVKICAAVGYAHQNQVIHRDLKPSNVLVTADGTPKLLDFGIAKLLNPELVAQTIDPTTLGVRLMTPEYASPEQVCGETVTVISDVYSLGVLLYELLTGHRPYRLRSRRVEELARVICETEPELPSLAINAVEVISTGGSELIEITPESVSRVRGGSVEKLHRQLAGGLDNIVLKALHKRPQDRYQSVDEFADDLGRYLDDLPVSAPTYVPPASHASADTSGAQTWPPPGADARRAGKDKRYQFAWAIGIAALVLAVAAAFGLSGFFGRRGASEPFQSAEIVRLTASGNATNAAISPDGRHVVYTIDEAGRQSLWVRQVTVASGIRLVAPAEVVYRGLTFSRDGSYVYYVVRERNGSGALYLVPALGGSAIKLKDRVDSPVGISPDGTHIAFVRTDAEHAEEALVIANKDGTGERRLASRTFPEHFSLASAPAWSPDNTMVAFVTETSDADGVFVRATAVTLDASAEDVLTPQRWLDIGQMAWLPDGGGFVMTAKNGDSSYAHLWFVSYPGGRARQITQELSDYKGVSLSADAGAILSVKQQTLTSLSIAPEGAPGDTTSITSGAGRYVDPSWTTDGKILFASDASGSADILEMEATGTDQRQLTGGAARNYGPAASPDGRHIVFHSNRSGKWQVWRMDRDGGNPVQLTSGAEESNWPAVSPEGRWVVYQHVGASALASLWRIPIDGGAPERLTDELAMRPAVSPDGTLIAYWQKEQAPNAPWRIAVISPEERRPVRVFDVPQSPTNGQTNVRWTRDGRAVLYLDYRDGATTLWSQPLGDAPPRKVHVFRNEPIYSVDVSRDGRLVFSRGLITNDVVLISTARSPLAR
jgi:serine/threonine protein kinase/Tol biopolymer transport system component